MEGNKIVVFDLDDTLYKEVDFLKSAYREIGAFLETHYMVNGGYEKMFRLWQEGRNAFEEIIREHDLPLSVDELIRMYRMHVPSIILDEKTSEVLSVLSKTCVMGLITDGRSVTQRNKIKALGLERFIEESNILISEETGLAKPASEPFQFFMDKYPNRDYYYIGDNPGKDFIAPNQLGWKTVCLSDDGRNIHHQETVFPDGNLPTSQINTLKDLLSLA